MLWNRLTQALVLLLAAGLCSGCSAVGALIFQTSGPSKVDAKYILPKEPTLVLVENARNPAAGQFDAEEIAHGVGDVLKEHEVVTVIDPDKLAAVKDADPDKYRNSSIAALGKAVSAKQVIYVNLIESGVESDPSRLSIHGKATARVRVINVASGQTLWPLDSTNGGVELGVEIPYTSDTDVSTSSTMHAAMIDQLSSSIARQFYDWKPDNVHEGDVAQ